MMKENVENIRGEKQRNALDRIVKGIVDCVLLLPVYI